MPGKMYFYDSYDMTNLVYEPLMVDSLAHERDHKVGMDGCRH